MTAPHTPASGQAKKAFQNICDVKRVARLPSRTARAALLIIFIAAVSVVAALPGSSAAPGRARAVSSPASADAAPTAPASAEAGRVAASLLPSAALAPAAAFFQAPPIATYAADCTTPKTSFNLGEVVCVKLAEAPSSGAAVVFSDPELFQRGAALPVSTTALSYSFTLPSSRTTGAVDNRGTWAAALVNTADNSRRAVAPFRVSDPQQAAADVTISKTLLDTVQAVAGGNTSFRVYVTNQGPDDATNVTFTDNTLPNTTFVSFTQDSGPAFNCTPPAVNTVGPTTCTRASMAVGDAASFTAVYKLNANIGNNAELVDTVGVTSQTEDPRDSSNSSTVETTASNPTPPACTLTCPANVSVAAAAGQTGAVVQFPDTALNGTCGAPSTSPASGTFFAIGTTVVTTSTSGGQSCSFTVTVTAAEDTVDPTISCPLEDITVDESSPSSNSAVVNYTVTAADDSGSVVVDCNPPSGSTFSAGTTEVRCTATDAAGNSASCTFNVTVNQSGCTLDANSAPPTPNAQSLPTITRACSVSLVGADSPTATDACGSTIIGTTPDRTFDTPGTHTVVWTYTDSAGHSTTQNQTIVIQPDNSAPVPDAASLPTVTGECSAAITGEAPTATDNCGGSGMVGVPLDPLSYNTPGTHTVRWKFTDAAGNSTIQNQTVIVTDGAAPVPNVASLPTLTGECSVTVTRPTATDNCAGTVTATTSDPLTYTTQGTHIVHWTYTDLAGNTTTQNQTVIVDDNTAPTIVAPAAKTINTGPNAVSCGVTIADLDGVLGTAAVNDNCAGANVVRSGVPAGGVFPVGQTTLTYTVTDVGGNTASATQVVTVVDNTPPTLAVPDVTVYLPLNSTATSMVVNYPAPTTGDNCPGNVSVVYNPASGSVFTVGPTTVTAVATDVHGNTTTKQFTVKVLYNFTGFFSPVENPPVFNLVKAGQSVPMKFSLSGNKGPGILAANSPVSAPVSCPGVPPYNEVSEVYTLTAGNSGLTYDALTDQYKYVWKTESGWVGTCRQFILRLNDGSEHRANFEFR